MPADDDRRKKPRKRVPRSSPAGSAKPQGQPLRPLILVIDDQPGPRLLTVLSLREGPLGKHYDVAEANGGNAGIARINDAFTEGRPLFVLCDLRMPPPDGLSVLAATRGRAPGPFRFVVYTVEAPPEAEKRAFELGADDVVTRLADSAALTERLGGRIERWLRASTAPTMPPGGF